MGQIAPAAVGERAGLKLDLPANTNIEFYQDFTAATPEVTVTRLDADGNEILAPGETPKPPPYPGKIVQMSDCYRWEVDVTQAETTTRLSCNPRVAVGNCGDRPDPYAADFDAYDCEVDDCKLSLPTGGPTQFEAFLHQRWDCGEKIRKHLLLVQLKPQRRTICRVDRVACAGGARPQLHWATAVPPTWRCSESGPPSLVRPRPRPQAPHQDRHRAARARLGVNKTLFCIDERGKTTGVKTTRKFPGDPKNDVICRDTVKRWRFRPLIVDGRPQRTCSVARFEIQFE